MILVVVDSHSGWIEAIPTNSASAATTVELLRSIFARFGLPSCLVSDNGTSFTGAEFQEFVKGNCIRHIRTAPYKPQSNGLAERAVRAVKDGLKRVTQGTLTARLSRWLHLHRKVPSGQRNRSPAELLLSYSPKMRLDLATMKVPELKPSRSSSFQVGDEVLCRNFGAGKRWLAGKVVNLEGNRMAKVKTALGLLRRHHDQLRRLYGGSPTDTEVRQEFASDDWLDVEQTRPQPQVETQETSCPQPGRPQRSRRPPSRIDL